MTALVDGDSLYVDPYLYRGERWLVMPCLADPDDDSPRWPEVSRG